MAPNQRKKRSQPTASRRQVLRTIGLGAAGLAILGSGGLAARRLWPSSGSDGGAVDFSERFAAFEPAEEPNGDVSKVVWPAFVTRAGPEVKGLYEFNIQNGELMRYMPCFCGCHLEDGHRNNGDCYVEAVDPDGSVVLDPMAPT